MIFNNHKAYTLVEMLVALAVSAIIIAATYASYEMVATQYHKNMDIADMHTSGRAIMRIIERDVRMAGFEYRDNNAIITYGSISNPLTIKDSGNKCCDEVTVVYDYFDEESKKSERIRIRYWAEPHTSNKGSRHRLYKQKDILGRNGSVLANPALGRKEVMADYIEDLQFNNTDNKVSLYVIGSSSGSKYIKVVDPVTKTVKSQIKTDFYLHYPSMTFGPDGLLYVIGSSSGSKYIKVVDPVTKTVKSQIKTDFYLHYPSMTYKSKRTGQESLVTINLTLRTKNQYGKDRQFKKKDYHSGNFKIDKTDKYKRDTFSTTVLVRNLAL